MLNEHLEYVLYPPRFIKNFKTMSLFREWAYLGNIKDLEQTIKAFEHYELYEHCAVLLEVLKEKRKKNKKK